MVDVWLQDDLKAATQGKFQGGNHVFFCPKFIKISPHYVNTGGAWMKKNHTKRLVAPNLRHHWAYGPSIPNKIGASGNQTPGNQPGNTWEYDIFHNTKHHRIVPDSRFFPTNQRRPHDIYKIIISIWDPRKSPDFLVHMEVSYKDTMDTPKSSMGYCVVFFR